MKAVSGEIFKYQSVKAKDEDSEWEMIWDAEGGMHLIKKGPKVMPVAVDLHTPGKRYKEKGRKKFDLHFKMFTKCTKCTN